MLVVEKQQEGCSGKKRSRLKEHAHFAKVIDNLSNGQARIEPEGTDLENVFVLICPNGGLYKGGRFLFKISMGGRYPDEPPKVLCLTPILHPNIDWRIEEICLSMLNGGDDDWLPHFGLEEVLQGLLFLLYYPNFDDPLIDDFQCIEGAEESAIFDSLRGITIETCDFKGPDFFPHEKTFNMDEEALAMLERMDIMADDTLTVGQLARIVGLRFQSDQLLQTRSFSCFESQCAQPDLRGKERRPNIIISETGWNV